MGRNTINVDLTYKNSLTLGMNEISFPDGATHFEGSFNTYGKYDNAKIVTRLSSGDDIFRLMVLMDYLNRQGVETCELFITYFLGARMDRSINLGPITPAVVANIIKNGPLKITRTNIFDPHSDVTPALMPNAWSYGNKFLLRRYLEENDKSGVLLFAPDQGALKKTSILAKEYGLPFTSGKKVRNINTGELTEFVLSNPAEIHNRDVRNVVIVDDICDGGGTFIGMAEAIREWFRGEHVDLIVSHGIFSRGKALKGIDKIYTTDSYQPLDAEDNFSVSKVEWWFPWIK